MSGPADALGLALQIITAARADGGTVRLKDGRLHAYDSKDKVDWHRDSWSCRSRSATNFPPWSSSMRPAASRRSAAPLPIGLRSFDLPPEVHEIVVLAAGDQADEAAPRDAALRWKRQGRRARIARPPQGLDFNDLLPSRAPQHVQGAT